MLFVKNKKGDYKMKKILFAIAIVLTISLTANAQGRDSFFSWNDADNETNRYTNDTTDFNLPVQHGSNDDTTVPVGSGLLIMTALGAAYALKKKQS